VILGIGPGVSLTQLNEEVCKLLPGGRDRFLIYRVRRVDQPRHGEYVLLGLPYESYRKPSLIGIVPGVSIAELDEFFLTIHYPVLPFPC
jgi:hypothetical protein